MDWSESTEAEPSDSAAAEVDTERADALLQDAESVTLTIAHRTVVRLSIQLRSIERPLAAMQARLLADIAQHYPLGPRP